ncbi:MAG: T9SS type A sorting domain-containing protein [Ignavibacteria bacterium]|nr:T9SS type A sorting domain-containing protein [Ignavibacteria bacterium]
MKKVYTILTTFCLFFGLGLFSQTIGQYSVDFEGTGETKTAYASGTVSLSGTNWDMTEALIGTDVSDWKNGNRSARMRGYGTSSMTMLANKSGGAGTVSFKYRRYGTDAQVDWKVEYSTNDGSSWTQIGSTFTAPASDVVQDFSQTVNITGNIRIRIKRATESGTSNRRLNIDDISITNYSGTSPTITVGSLTSFGNQTVNTTSGEKSYSVSGANLTADIVITPPAGFEISTTSGSGFVANPSSLTLTQSGGTVASTTIYTRFVPTLVQAYSGNIVHTSTDATTQNVAVSGTGTNSNNSDIIENSAFVYPTNIPYANYQNTDIVGDGGDIEIAQFTIRDGGGSADADGLGTILNSVTFSLSNSSFIRRVALYDGAAEVGTETAGSSSFTFSGLTLTAPDNGTKTFSVRVSFNTNVTDNQQIQLTITGVTADASGSVFASANGGGAVSSISGENNKIEVSASKLVFTASKPPASVYINAPFNVEIKAQDANNNTDLDAVNSVTLSRTTGTGIISSITGLTQTLSSGVYAWNDIKYNTVETFVITASASGLTDAVTGSISCQSTPIANHVVIAEIYGGGGNTGAPYKNDYIVLYNPTGSSVDLSTWSIQYASSAGTFSTNITNLTGSILANNYYLIKQAGGSNGIDLPVTPNVTGIINMSATAGKVALVNDQVAISGIGDGNVVDFVGFGSAANEFEGTAPTSAPSNTSSIRRKSNEGTNTYGSGNGCDSDDNSMDFYVETDIIINAPLPVELTSFTAKVIAGKVSLNWTTSTEVNNYGFEVERSLSSHLLSLSGHLLPAEWEKIGFVAGSGNSNSLKEYSFADDFSNSAIQPFNHSIRYRLKQIDNDGTFAYSKIVEVGNLRPSTFDLLQNFPNPFNPSTMISYQLPVTAQVTLKVFDVLGNEVVSLVNQQQEAGSYNVTLDASTLASGTYIYRLIAGDFVSTKKLVVLK